MHFIHEAKISDYNREPDLETIFGTWASRQQLQGTGIGLLAE